MPMPDEAPLTRARCRVARSSLRSSARVDGEPPGSSQISRFSYSLNSFATNTTIDPMARGAYTDDVGDVSTGERVERRPGPHPGPAVVVPALLLVSGIVAGAAADYLQKYGPSGGHPYSWSYTGNGALDVFVYLLASLAAGWGLIGLARGGYGSTALIVSGSVAELAGVMGGLVNEVGVLGQLPNTVEARTIFGVIANGAIPLLALAAGLRLAGHFSRVTRRSVIAGVVLTTFSVAVGIGYSTIVNSRSGSKELTQSVLAALIVLVPLLFMRPGERYRAARSGGLLALGEALLLPVATGAGFALGMTMASPV